MLLAMLRGSVGNMLREMIQNLLSVPVVLAKGRTHRCSCPCGIMGGGPRASMKEESRTLGSRSSADDGPNSLLRRGEMPDAERNENEGNKEKRTEWYSVH